MSLAKVGYPGAGKTVVKKSNRDEKRTKYIFLRFRRIMFFGGFKLTACKCRASNGGASEVRGTNSVVVVVSEAADSLLEG